MKKASVLILAVLLSSAGFYSCKKEIPAARRLDENWLLEKIDYGYYNLAGELIHSDTESGSGSYILLFADLNFHLYYQRALTKGTYTLGNNQLNLSFLKGSSTGASRDTTIAYTVMKKTQAEFSFYNEKQVVSGKERATLYFRRD